MPEFKRQHFLPASYLKYFSTDRQNCSRDSFIWRFDGKALRLVPVTSQCSEDYFYSKTDAAKTEQMFQKAESNYCNCVDRIFKNQAPSGIEYGNLVIAMFDLHLRNRVHKNLTGKQRIDAYNLCSGIFVNEILLGRKDRRATKEDLVEHVQNYWGVHVFQISGISEFVTSDHPSMWTILKMPSDGSHPRLHMVTLPLTPKHTAVAFDNRVLQIFDDPLSVNDEQTLNIGQIQNADQCIYTSGRLSDEHMEMMRGHFAKNEPSPCEVRENGWKLSLQYLPPEHHFSFTPIRA